MLDLTIAPAIPAAAADQIKAPNAIDLLGTHALASRVPGIENTM
jgi:hypothetical protein